MEIDDMGISDISAGGLTAKLESDDPAVGLRAVGALHRLAENVEASSVKLARDRGWSWEQIGDALGISRQSAHAKYGREVDDAQETQRRCQEDGVDISRAGGAATR
jgi:hypothetical protein